MNYSTPIDNIDHKIDIIDHVNQDHPEELLAIAKSHSHQQEIKSAKVENIYQEGVQISMELNATQIKQNIFVPFEIEGSLEDKILYLAYASIVKQGLDFSGNGKQFFEITNKQNITQNIIRLTLKSDMPLPQDYAGYAYAFVLKGMKKKTNGSKTNKKHWLKSVFDHLFILLMKHLSKKNREQLLYKANKNVRLYTLRRSWKHGYTSLFPDRGEIDIYTHGNSPGSEWAEQLCIGDFIMSRSETADKHPHLISGQAAIIADETAYPAAAGILENWTNPIPPLIIIISSHQEEQGYFSQKMFPINSRVFNIICSENDQSSAVLSVLKECKKVDVIWAALESSSAKEIRHYLRNERKIRGKNNHTKAYWKLSDRQFKSKK